MDKAVAGARLRRLREGRSLSQADLARLLAISPSYLNQIEHGSRPLTVPVLMRITETFGVDPGFFAAQDPARLIAELHEVFAEVTPELAVPAAELARLARDTPGAAEAVIALYRRYRQTSEHLAAATGPASGAAGGSVGGAAGDSGYVPHEEVRDFFYRRHNHVAELEERAEVLAAEIGVRRGEVRRALADRLRDAHGVRLARLDDSSIPAGDPRSAQASDLHRYDPAERVLRLAGHLRAGQQAFRMATQLAFLEHDELLDDLARPVQPRARALTRIGLANYFAAALILPYGEFHQAAEAFRYDIERLADHFAVGFETAAHRLSTLQRSAAPGVPFSFVRVDRAGNMSKRQSATGFHFSRGGGTCPLWTVYLAFSAPGTVQRQVASMPDGRRYLWIARTVTRGRGRWGAPGKMFAIGLGCEIRHAPRLVYATGLDLDDPAAATPIGAGCRVCERDDCAQRAFPRLGHDLAVTEDRSTYVPYPVLPR
ncbi:Cro/Cl family transcriptional regulator [Frankia sp. R43]|uniref:short-chain fatty acyl-CoA regulator family protein n=1 Tax=Frankia sp. R43 TaxID=269536 RepID=UPI0006CA521C|nr:Cro/Cl family transcriptional regulator [Frankia sp. R43]